MSLFLQSKKIIIALAIIITGIGLYPSSVFAADLYLPVTGSSGGSISPTEDSNGYDYWSSVADYMYFGSFTFTSSDYLWVFVEFASGTTYLSNEGDGFGFTGVTPDIDNSFTVDGHTIHALRYPAALCTGMYCSLPASITDLYYFNVNQTSGKRVYGAYLTTNSSTTFVDDEASLYAVLPGAPEPPVDNGSILSQIFVQLILGVGKLALVVIALFIPLSMLVSAFNISRFL